MPSIDTTAVWTTGNESSSRNPGGGDRRTFSPNARRHV
jgi:hypothetical protein